MSDLHLSTGSQEPPKVPGLIRLYSMKFCPYVHRVKLVLLAKRIPHDVVNINLINKPEWYFKIHPEGYVPALDTGSRIILESLDIADYLEETYPENPLYPENPIERQKDKDLISKIINVVKVFNKCVIYGGEEKSPAVWLNEFLEVLQDFEKELERRNATFFGGNKPGMVDYMLWPWAERVGAIKIKLGELLPIQNNHIPFLKKWRKAMLVHPIVNQLYLPIETYWKIVLIKLKKIPPDYDSIHKL